MGRELLCLGGAKDLLSESLLHDQATARHEEDSRMTIDQITIFDRNEPAVSLCTHDNLPDAGLESTIIP